MILYYSPTVRNLKGIKLSLVPFLFLNYNCLANGIRGFFETLGKRE